MSEVSTDRWIDIPGEVIDIYILWSVRRQRRPSGRWAEDLDEASLVRV